VFFVQNFGAKNTSALRSFSRYVLAKKAHLYEKYVRKMLMKLTPGVQVKEGFKIQQKFGHLSHATILTVTDHLKYL